MSESRNTFTCYWAQHRIAALKALPPEAPALPMLFGGPHVSQPSFLRAGVAAGDRIIVIGLARGSLLVVAGLTVAQIGPVSEVMPAGMPGYADHRTGDWAARAGWPEKVFYSALCVTCTEEAIVAADAVRPPLPRPLPPEALRRFVFLNQRGARRPKGVETGRVTAPLAFQGNYRVHPDTARDLEAALVSTTDVVEAVAESDASGGGPLPLFER